MKPTLEGLRSFVTRTDPQQAAKFRTAIKKAREIVVIGSAATGKLTTESDLDLLLVGEGRRLKTKHLDLIWISPSDLKRQSWLGSELATHAAYHGVWVKGRGAWARRVFFSDVAVSQKCERILVRLCRVYLKRSSLSHSSKIELLSKAVLDMQRAVLLAKEKPVPSTYDLIQEFLRAPEKTYAAVCAPKLIGDVGRHFITKFLPKKDIIRYLRSKQVGEAAELCL